MTQSDELTRKAAREGSPPADAVPEINAQARAHARAMVAPVTSVAFDAVTTGVQAARRQSRTVTALLDRPESLFHARPPSFRELHGWHTQCANHYEVAVALPRRLWGYVHLFIVVPPLRALEWITASPARLVVALALAVAIWYWS